MSENLNLSNLLSSMQPSLVTPELKQFTGISNDKKLKLMAKIIVKKKAEAYNKSNDYKTPHLIMHEGKSIAVRFLNVEPLMTGVWAAMSLNLLSLSYGEQATLIEAFYPPTTQLAAKSFATIFTATPDQSSQDGLAVHESDDVMGKLDSANAGIAILISMLTDQGFKLPHPDQIDLKLKDMDDMVEAKRRAEDFKRATKRAQAAKKAHDKERGR